MKVAILAALLSGALGDSCPWANKCMNSEGQCAVCNKSPWYESDHKCVCGPAGADWIIENQCKKCAQELSAADPTLSWGRLPAGECQSDTVPAGTCFKCEGVPTSTSGCTMVNGFDFGTSITSSATDDQYLLSACGSVAGGDGSLCDNIPDQGQKGACQTVIRGGGGNAISIWVKRSCHTDPLGGSPNYNYCNVYKCSRNPEISDLDGHCSEPVGCQGTFMMYTKGLSSADMTNNTVVVV